MKQKTKQQHYIPNKSYLNYFVDQSLDTPALWVYFNKQEVINDAANANCKPITPINLCKESYLYETPHLPVNAIEHALQKIEDDYKSVLDKKIIPQKRLTHVDKRKLSYFFSTLEVRTPLNKENTNDFINQMREMVTHLEEAKMGGQKSDLHKQLDLAQAQNLMFTQMLIAAVDVNRFGHVDMLFLTPDFEDERMFFITSDFPVTMENFVFANSFYPSTPMDATVEVVIPLTPKIAVLCNNIGLNGYKRIDHNFVREVNNRTLRRANKFIISSKKLDKDFGDYTARRFPQSFLLLAIEKKLQDISHRKVDKILKNRVENLLKNTVANYVQFMQERGIKVKSQVKSIAIFTDSDRDFKWLAGSLNKMGVKTQETSTGVVYRLKNPVNTLAGRLILVKVKFPKNTTQEEGDADFEVPNIETIKQVKNLTLNHVNKNGYDALELWHEGNHVLTFIPLQKSTQ